MRELQEWYFIKLTIPEGIELTEEEIENILNDLNIKFKYVIESFIIIDKKETNFKSKNEKINLEIIKLLDLKIQRLIDQNELSLKDKTIIMDEYSNDVIITKEIIFEFDIVTSAINEEEIFSLLRKDSDIKINEYSTEAEFLKKTDYAESKYTETPLIHNIRCDNIAVLTLQTMSLNPGIIFMGYMRFSNKTKIILKAFNFEMLKYVFDQFMNSFNNLDIKANLNWERLLSRKISKGYRENHRHIVENDLMKKFLEVSKGIDKDSYFITVLKKLMNAGYLTEDEFSNIPKKGREAKLLSYLNEFKRIKKAEIENDFIWIDPSTGLVFLENSKTDAVRIKEISSSYIERIYAPSPTLLHYIRAYWHQEYIKDIFSNIKNKWNEENFKIEIIEFLVDLQFDLKRTGKPEKESRDIDILVRLKNKAKNIEYIVAVEAKRNGNDVNGVEKDIIKKISAHYSSIFSGFLTIAFFKYPNMDGYKESKVFLSDEDQKILISCIDPDKLEMEEKIIKALIRISEYE